MLFPGFFSDNLIDEILNDRTAKKTFSTIMATDVVEYDKGYQLEIDLPGCKKENVQAQLKDGYLTVTAEVKDNSEENDASRFIRRERRRGSFTRSFYVGDALTQDDIRARFEDGVLKIAVPKETAHPEIEDKHLIAIEG